MFFFLSKTLDLLLDPWWWGVVPLALSGALFWRGRRRAGAVASGLGLFALVFFSLPAVANRLWHSLEADAANTFKPEVPYDAVVLLGGAVTAEGTTPEQVSWGHNVDRLTITFDLLKSGKARFAIVSGGVFREGLPTEAEYLARQLEAWGIEPSRIIVEPKALNTKENASYSKALIDERGFRSVLIVTSAFHMTRAQACFRAVGLEPDTLPVDYRMREPAAWDPWMPRTRYLYESSEALRELSGRLVYRLTGAAR